MQFTRTLAIMRIELSAIVRKLRYDLMKEIVVAICAVIIFGLFFYVFGDFVEQHLSRLSPSLKSRIANGFGFFVVATLPLLSLRASFRHREGTDLASLMARIGESPAQVRCFRRLSAGMKVVGSAAVAALTVNWFLPSVTLATLGLSATLALVISGLLHRHQSRPRASVPVDIRPGKLWQSGSGASRAQVMLSWRVFQILRRNRTAQAAIVLGITAHILALVVGLTSTVTIGMFGFAVISGFLLAMPMSFQLHEDLRHSWAERMMGVSHDDVVRSYQRISYFLTAFILASFSVVGLPFMDIDRIQLLQIAVASCCFVWIMPGLLFQIDGRRPLIQICINLLFGIFVATALYIHWAALVLIPILNYYTVQYQSGRYYRA
jgi:hypothetical protein